MTHLQIALQVTQTMDKKTSDRYDLIWAIKEILLVSSPVLVTCRETIDSVLDLLFEMGYKS
tara:strand:+ start:175 stop:357 length:183 start_codon:yes stop_codon:yes gene_type:complete